MIRQKQNILGKNWIAPAVSIQTFFRLISSSFVSGQESRKLKFPLHAQAWWTNRASVARPHPRRPRGSQSGREKRRDESFQAQAEKPLGTHSHRTISKRSSECWLLIGPKKCFVLFCPIGEQFLRSSFREFVYDGYSSSRHSCPVRSPSFPNQTKELPMSRKRFGCYQQEQFNLHWENSVSDGSQCIVITGSLRCGGARQEIKKTIAWQGKTTTLHVHHILLYISLPSLQDYHVKMPSFSFCEGCKQAMSANFLSLYELGYGW